jgi:hypothetical protein
MVRLHTIMRNHCQESTRQRTDEGCSGGRTRRTNASTRAHVLLRYVAGSVLCAAVSLAETPATLVRQTPAPRTSGPLSVSLQQEVQAAMARSRAWLVACQNADGSWGALGSARLRLTAIAALTMAYSAAPDEAKALERAQRWLGAPAASTTAAAGDWEAQIWQELALQAIQPPEPRRTAAFVQQCRVMTNALASFPRMLMQAAAPTIGLPPRATVTNAAAPSLLEACLLAMCTTATDPRPTVLSQVAAAWHNRPYPAYPPTQQAWILAHFINRAGGGSLADASGRLVNWRHDLANELVASQQIDTQRQGNGFWPGAATNTAASDAAVTATAYALLALGEL